jgi:hypothetical protein
VAAVVSLATPVFGVGWVAILNPVPSVVSRVAAARANGRAVLIIGRDDLDTDATSTAWRNEESRADVILVARWLRDCDRLDVIAIPRDLVLVQTNGMQISVFYGLAGLAALSNAIETATGIDLVATAVLDLSDVDALVRALGSVEVWLPSESRDLRTGFAAGPGAVRLEGRTTSAFLRSRELEEYSNGQWLFDPSGDLGRIGREQQFLAGALTAISKSSLSAQVRVGLVALTHVDVSIRDPVAAAGFSVGVRSVDHVEYTTLASKPERSIAERSSPFPPAHLGAFFRLVPARGAFAAVRNSSCSTRGR